MFRYLTVVFLILLTDFSFGQTVFVDIQDESNATIGLDRKAFNGLGDTSIHSYGYAHDFILPARTNPCQQITGISIEISLTNYAYNGPCPHSVTYYNLFYGCTSYTGGATCLPATNLIAEPNYAPDTSPPPFNFGSPLGSPLNPNIVPDFGDNLSIDIIPVSDPGCDAVTNGDISYEYTITVTVTVTENPALTPDFTAVQAICEGDALTALPTTSNNGVTGTWSPALDNTSTTSYTFTPDADECSTTQTMTITVNPIVNPTFAQVAPICIGDSLSALPTTSNEGVTGTWSPALDNTSTTTYTFTPDTGQCATSQIMTVTVNPITTSTFTQVSAICSGDSLSALPTTSNEGIVGTWSPVLDNTSSTMYTFIPDAGQCASNQTMTITVNPIITPTFNQVTPICIDDVLNPLPTTSNEGITGSWSPAVDNMLTTTYTFTPDSGQCAVTQTMTITVNPNQAPVFDPVLPICNGETLAPLPTISLNGIPGTWSPDLNNTVTKTYTFIPDAGFCPSTFNLTITVNDNPSFSLQEEYFLCFEQNGDLAFPTIIDTGLNPTMYNFRWLLNGLEISGASQGTYSPIEGGSYEVVVQNNLTGCSSTEVTEVIPLYQPEFEAEVITAAFSENPTIQVSTMSSGDFEYQLDDNPWQDEPFFDNVSIGEHNVKVRDKRGCIESDDTLVVMGYPKFFTPNNDGYNDTWNIVAPISPIDYLASARIFIFNRFGKLLKELNPSGEGWKGIYNGVTMPSDDYWFIVEYTEPNSDIRKQFKSHFTLKR